MPRTPTAVGGWGIVESVLTVAVLGFLGYRLAGAARHAGSRHGRERVIAIVRGIRWRHVWPVPFVLAAVAITASVLVQVPGLSFGWWSALGGTASPVLGTTSTTDGTVLSWLLPLGFVALLVPALPLFAMREEQIFRQGAQNWSARRRVWMAVRFGITHALIGIPIGVALALSIGGAWFIRCYLVGFRAGGGDEAAGVLESTRAHTAYNACVVTLLVVLVTTSALTGQTLR